MKKVISLLLALAMVMSLSVTAFAAEGDVSGAGTGEYSTNVTGSYVAGTTASGTVFSVDISWTAMSFTYHAEKAPVWDADNHKYSDSSPAKWEGEGTITVTNHSNTKITAVPVFNAADGYGEVKMKFSTDKLRVASAETGSAQTGTITVTPEGKMAAVEGKVTIGTITVTIAQDTDVTIEEARALVTLVKELESTAKASGVYDTYEDEFYSMNRAYSSLEFDLEIYDGAIVSNGSYTWGDIYGDVTYEEFQYDRLNPDYNNLLSSYNTCKNLAGM